MLDKICTNIVTVFLISILLTSSFVYALPDVFAEPEIIPIANNDNSNMNKEPPGQVKKYLDTFSTTPLQEEIKKQVKIWQNGDPKKPKENNGKRDQKNIPDIKTEILSLEDIKKNGKIVGKKIQTKTTLTFTNPEQVEPTNTEWESLLFSRDMVSENIEESFEDLCSQANGVIIEDGEVCDFTQGAIDNLTKQVLDITQEDAVGNGKGKFFKINNNKVFKDKSNPDGIDFNSRSHVSTFIETISVEFPEDVIDVNGSFIETTPEPSLTTQSFDDSSLYNDPFFGSMYEQILPVAEGAVDETINNIPMMMGFTIAPPKFEWGIHVSDEACFSFDVVVSIIPWKVETKHLCTDLYDVQAGFEFNNAAAFRLPVTLEVITPVVALPDEEIPIKSKIIQRDFLKQDFINFCNESRNTMKANDALLAGDCERFALENDVWDGDGNEAAANVIIAVGISATALGFITIVDESFGPNIDYIETCTDNNIRDYFEFDLDKLIFEDAERQRLNTILDALTVFFEDDETFLQFLKENNLHCGTFKTPYGIDPDTGDVMTFPFTEGAAISVPAVCGISKSKIFKFLFKNSKDDGVASAINQLVDRFKDPTDNKKDLKSKSCTNLAKSWGYKSVIAFTIGLGASAEITPFSDIIGARFSSSGDSVAQSKGVNYVSHDSFGLVTTPQQRTDFVKTGEFDSGTDSVIVNFDDFNYQFSALKFDFFAVPEVTFKAGLSKTFRFNIPLFSLSQSLGAGIPVLEQHAFAGPATVAIPIDYSLKFQIPDDIIAKADGPITSVDLGTPLNTGPGTLDFTNDAPVEGFPVGKSTVTWAITSNHGNTVTKPQFVTVIDTSVPEITAPSDVLLEGTAPLTPVDLGTPIAFDIESTPSVTNDSPSGFPVGDTIVTWFASDGTNTGTDTQLVTIIDTTNPAISGPADITKESTGQKTDVDLGSPGVSDLVGISSTTNNAVFTTHLESFCLGTDTYELLQGVGFTCTTTDRENICVSGCSWPSTPRYENVCPSGYSDWRGLECFRTPNQRTIYEIPIGSHVIGWTTVDTSGNEDTSFQTVTVQDTTPPEIDFFRGTNPFGEPIFTDIPNVTIPALYVTTPSFFVFTALTQQGIIQVTDNSGTGGLLETNLPPSLPVGVFTIIWNATDQFGNSATETSAVTVTDSVAPIFIFEGTGFNATETIILLTDLDSVNTIPPDIFVEATGSSIPLDDVPLEFSMVYDFSPTDITTNATEINFGTNGILWQATDSSGNTASTTQTVTLQDTTPPVVTDPADVTEEATAVDTPLSDVPLGTATATDIFEIKSITSDAPDTFPLGDTLVHWTATDENGNSATTTTQTVTIIDTTPPTITAPTDVTEEATAVDTPLSDVTLGTPTVFDLFPVTTTNDAPDTFPLGTTTVTWTATDENGNSSTATQDITIQDTTPPVVTDPADVTEEATAVDTPLSDVPLGTATATDIFEIKSITSDAPDTFPLGDTLVHWTATDENGNSATTTTQTVTIIDTTPPTITAPTDVTEEATAVDTPLSDVTLGTPTVFDLFPVTTTNDAPDTFPLGTTTVTWTATDENGNSSTTTQDVIIVDTMPPTLIIPKNIIGEATNITTSVNIGTATSEDIFDVNITNDAPSTFPLGTTTVTWTATDANGLTSTKQQTITIQDTTHPILSMPSDITTEALALLTTVILGDVTATDIFPVTTTNDAPDTFPLGTTTVTWTATDENGNSSTATQDITIQDTTSPVVTDPADVTEEATAVDTPLSDVPLGTATATDIFEITSITSDAPDTFPLGDTLVHWTATDENGNSATTTQTVTLQDTTPPTITAPVDVTEEATAVDTPLSDVTLGTPTVFDLFPVTTTNDAPDTFPLGTTTVTWTAEDFSLNSASDDHLVTIVDITSPELTIPTNILAECNTNGGAIDIDLGQASATDIVDLTPAITNDSPDFYPLGLTQVVWTVTDFSLNSESDIQDVSIQDTTPPDIATPPDLQVIANTAGGWSGDIGQAISFDICNDVTVTNDAPSMFSLDVGENSHDTMVTWTATDADGNISTATQTITVNPLTITIDIKPDSDENPINTKSNGVIPLAILSVDGFDATTIAPLSLLFGPSGTTESHQQGHSEDANGDGVDDMIVHFKTQDTGIQIEMVEMCLVGATVDGIPVTGCDSISIVSGDDASDNKPEEKGNKNK